MRWGGRWPGGGEVALRRVRGRLSLRGVFMHMSAVREVFCLCDIETWLDKVESLQFFI